MKHIFSLMSSCLVVAILSGGPVYAGGSEVADAVLQGKKDVLRSLLQKGAIALDNYSSLPVILKALKRQF